LPSNDLSKSRSSKWKIAGGSTFIGANSGWAGLSKQLCSPAMTKDGGLQNGARPGIEPPVTQLLSTQARERRLLA